MPAYAQTTTAALASDALMALAVVIGAPLALWWWTRRNRVSRPRRLQISDKVALGKSQWVAVLEVDSRRFLVGAGESGIGLLSELEPSPEELSPVEDPDGSPATPNTDVFGAPAHDQPWMGLVRRLQHMTVRKAPPPRRRSVRATSR